MSKYLLKPNHKDIRTKSISIPLGNVRKPEVFWRFHGVWKWMLFFHLYGWLSSGICSLCNFLLLNLFSWNSQKVCVLIFHTTIVIYFSKMLWFLLCNASKNDMKMWRKTEQQHNVHSFHATVLFFITPWKYQETRGILMFSGRKRPVALNGLR